MRKTIFILFICFAVSFVAFQVRIHGQEKKDDTGGPLFRVKYNGVWGFVNRKGEIVIKPQFEEVTDFGPEGVAVVRIAGNYTFIDRKGKKLVKPVYDGIWGFHERPAGLKVSNRWGYMNKGGKVVVDALPLHSPRFSSGLTPVEVNGKWGYAGTNGEIVIKPQYYRVWPFRDGLGEVWISPNPNTKVGYIDKTGEYVWAPKR